MLWHIYVALLPAGSIHEFPFAHPSGLPSTSAAPANSIVEDLQAALAQFAEIVSDLDKNKGL